MEEKPTQKYWEEKDMRQCRMAALKDICLILERSNLDMNAKIEMAERYAIKWTHWISTGKMEKG